MFKLRLVNVIWSVDIKTIIIFEIKWESNSETEIKYILHLCFDIFLLWTFLLH